MSSLLEQAIADAKMLKETARKNAEAAILEQYSEEIKNSIESLLEQDETGSETTPVGGLNTTSADTTAITPGAVKPEVKKTMDRIPATYLNEDGMQEIELDLNSLVEKVAQLEEEVQPERMPKDTQMYEGGLAGEEDVAEQIDEVSEEGDKKRAAAAEKDKDSANLKAQAAQADAKKSTEEASKEGSQKKSTSVGASKMSLEEQEFTLDEEIMMDMENVRDPDNTEIELNKQKKIAAALEAQKDELLATVEKKEEEKNELEEALDAAIAKLSETKAKLKKSLDLNIQLKEGVEYLTQKVSESNLLNARLLYTNKTLGNTSLNERQKKQLAESISSASSVEEARTIYETLLRSSSSVAEKRTAPQSLTEALNKAPSPFLPRKTNTVDPALDRWKTLAGIKK
jgi:hypothetical protein